MPPSIEDRRRGKGLDYDEADWSCNRTWTQGAWRKIDELKLVKKAVDIIASAMHGPLELQSALGQPLIARWSVNWMRSMAPPNLLSAIGDVVLTDDTFNASDDYIIYTVIHELGHVWDHGKGYGLSRGLMEALHTVHYYGYI
jgi:hypothetical protein